jgi:hypothetical protein
MKKAGYIVSLVGVIVDSVFSGIIGLGLLGLGVPVLAAIIFVLIAAEIVAIVNYKKSNGWVIFLLVLGALTILISLNNGTFSITGIALLVGTILTLASKDQVKTLPVKTYTLEEAKAELEKESQ